MDFRLRLLRAQRIFCVNGWRWRVRRSGCQSAEILSLDPLRVRELLGLLGQLLQFHQESSVIAGALRADTVHRGDRPVIPSSRREGLRYRRAISLERAKLLVRSALQRVRTTTEQALLLVGRRALATVS
jgi:hypothetical protein